MKKLFKLILWIAIIYLLIKYCPLLFVATVTFMTLIPFMVVIGLIWIIFHFLS